MNTTERRVLLTFGFLIDTGASAGAKILRTLASLRNEVALIAVVVVIAVGILAGSAGFRPEPQNAEAALPLALPVAAVAGVLGRKALVGARS
jgi:hypothetical protein